MNPLRVATYAAHAAAALALLLAARRVPSLRRPAWAVLAWLALSPLRGFDRSDGRAFYHLAQAAEWADHAAMVLLVGASPRAAAALWCVLFAAGLAWWPAPATVLYAGAQFATVGLCVGLLAREARSARVPLPGHLAQLVLVVGEALTLIAPYALALAHGTTAAEEWTAVRVVRLATWAALAVIGWRSWRSAPPLFSSERSWSGSSGQSREARRMAGSSESWQRPSGSGGAGESGSGGEGASPG